MKTSRLDRIGSLSPLDRQAAVIRDSDGEHWDGRVRDGRDHWSEMPPTRPVPWNCESMIGRKVGRLTAVGLYVERSSSNKWVVRCACGAFETRLTGFFKRDHGGLEQCCAKCDYLRHIRDIEFAERHGRWPDGRPYARKGGLYLGEGRDGVKLVDLKTGLGK